MQMIMKNYFNFRSITLASLAACTLMLAGCASTPADRAANMSKDVSKTGSQLDGTRQGVTQVLTTLNQMITQPNGDMRSQYKDYLSSVKSLNDTALKLDQSINTMVANSQVYFADWGNQVAAINDSTLKQLSADRKQQAVNSLNELKSAMDKARASFKPLAKDLDDIGLYLGNNLTASGIAAMKPRLDTIKVEAVGVRDALSSTANALNKFSGTLATSAK
jgi:hypothetical protein